MDDYYAQKLSGDRLRRCYELAPPRVRRYLQAEIDHVLDRMPPGGSVLELGCGYGRALPALAARAREVAGIDTSLESLRHARAALGPGRACRLAAMNAVELGFGDRRFDTVICIQNGIAVFRVDQRRLIHEARRVTRPGGRVLLSSYSSRFWPERLAWFRIQADHGLLGEIDDDATGDGIIVCRDGFRSTTAGVDDFRRLTADLDPPPTITEVDGSSLFCEIAVR